MKKNVFLFIMSIIMILLGAFFIISAGLTATGITIIVSAISNLGGLVVIITVLAFLFAIFEVITGIVGIISSKPGRSEHPAFILGVITFIMTLIFTLLIGRHQTGTTIYIVNLIVIVLYVVSVFAQGSSRR